VTPAAFEAALVPAASVSFFNTQLPVLDVTAASKSIEKNTAEHLRAYSEEKLAIFNPKQL